MSKARQIGMMLSLFGVWACAAPPPESKPAQTYFKGRQNYCLGNVASLGTGLLESPASVNTKSSSPRLKRWTGWLRASASGKYEFSLPESGGRIIVNQQPIFVHSPMSAKAEVDGIELLTNRFYAITVEAPDGDTELPLHWRRPDGRYEPVPRVYLYAPVATAESVKTI